MVTPADLRQAFFKAKTTSRHAWWLQGVELDQDFAWTVDIKSGRLVDHNVEGTPGRITHRHTGRIVATNFAPKTEAQAQLVVHELHRLPVDWKQKNARRLLQQIRSIPRKAMDAFYKALDRRVRKAGAA